MHTTLKRLLEELNRSGGKIMVLNKIHTGEGINLRRKVFGSKMPK